MQFTSIWCIDRTLSGATTPGQSVPGSNGNEGMFCIHQSSSITETSPSKYTVHSLEKILLLCKDALSVFYSPSWLGKPSPCLLQLYKTTIKTRDITTYLQISGKITQTLTGQTERWLTRQKKLSSNWFCCSRES